MRPWLENMLPASSRVLPAVRALSRGLRSSVPRLAAEDETAFLVSSQRALVFSKLHKSTTLKDLGKSLEMIEESSPGAVFGPHRQNVLMSIARVLDGLGEDYVAQAFASEAAALNPLVAAPRNVNVEPELEKKPERKRRSPLTISLGL